MAHPTLSIIIATWNTALVTQKCITTLQSHLSTLSHEIILVDNGSTDDTQKLFQGDKSIVYIRNSTNLGFAKANNIGARRALGEYLLFLNSDMELIDSSLIKMLEYLQSHPTIGLIGPKFLNPDLTPQSSVFPPQTPYNAFRQYFLGQAVYSKYLPAVSTPTPVWAISGGAVLVSRQLFVDIGLWNEKYFMYFEDMDLCRQVRARHLQIVFYPHCQVIHRHGASGQHLANTSLQWRRLIPGSILYHGWLTHQLITFILWSGQKFQRLFKLK